jgi:serine/threonine protein kinase
MTMGTVNYMAPEQRTDAKRVDQRADLYAAGVILYELLTGDLPLGRFALPTEKGLNVPASVDRLIIKALARNAEERFQHAREFDAAVAAIEAEIAPARVDVGAERDTVVGGGDTLPGRAAPPRGLQRDSSAPGEPALPSLSPAMVAGVSGVSGVGTAVDSFAPQAWVTMLPAVQLRTIGSAVALLVGTLLGLLILRGL